MTCTEQVTYRLIGAPDDPLGAPLLDADELAGWLEQAGLTGRGGAGFPSARKLRAVATSGARAVVVGNGAEGEPASSKDAWLLASRPHLVLDGLRELAGALPRSDVYLYAPHALAGRLQALADRRHAARIDRRRVRVVPAADTFISGEESAVVNAIAGGTPVPRMKPPLLVQSGLDRRPTLVHNVETLAQLALLAAYGPQWYRRAGTPEEPGTLLLTVTGAVSRPGILEAEHGTPLADVLEAAGGETEPLSAVLLGGYHGGWLRVADVPRATMSRPVLQGLGASLGAGIVVALPASVCGLVETARVVEYLAGQSARQCGPCLNGLPRLAQLTATLARHPGPATVREAERICGLVDGRGACRHPDGTARFIGSALRAFPDELRRHQAGYCGATRFSPVLPTGGAR